jgi:hypothetical protein
MQILICHYQLVYMHVYRIASHRLHHPPSIQHRFLPPPALSFLRFSLQLGLLCQRANLQLATVLVQDVLAMVLPELLRRIFASHALEDLCASGVLVDEICGTQQRRRVSTFVRHNPLQQETEVGLSIPETGEREEIVHALVTS